MPEKSRRELGLEMIHEVYAADLGLDKVEDDYQALCIDHLFGDIWQHKELDIRDRRMITLGVVASEGLGDVVEMQFFSALERGELTPEQVNLIVIHLTEYLGWPRSVAVYQAARAAIAKHEGAEAKSGP
jgi:4-carboxymuconolactone decarboxylase